VLNPVKEIGQLVRQHLGDQTIYFIDAMSSFGGVQIDFASTNVDFLVSSANKCLEGVPGFSYVLASKKKLETCKGNSRSLSLDLWDQLDNFEKNGNQFRFTPPTHAIVALDNALDLLDREGGIAARSLRYISNHRILSQGMSEMGFKKLVDLEHDCHIITSFFYPKHPNFNFPEFYTRLNQTGNVIYPGKVSSADCFRIGCIGDLFPNDFQVLLSAIRQTMSDMKIPLPLSD